MQHIGVYNFFFHICYSPKHLSLIMIDKILIWACVLAPMFAYKRIIVIPDMHGDADALLQSLYAGYSDIVHGALRVDYEEFAFRFNDVIKYVRPPVRPLYEGNDVAIVQLGDLIDRGEHSLQCLLIMKAARMVTGFDVHQILGNHELAVAIGRPFFYSRSIHPDDDLVRITPSPVMWKHVVADKQFKPMIKLGDTLFVHAGVTLDQLAEDRFIEGLSMMDEGADPVDHFNEMVWADLLEENPSFIQREYLHQDSFFTMRKYSDPDLECDQVLHALELFGAARVVVGHMASRTNTVRQNCDGAIILADFMASRYMNIGNPVPHPGALMIAEWVGNSDPQIHALYYDIEAKTSYIDNIPFQQIAPLGIRRYQIIVSSVSSGEVVPTGVHVHMNLLTTDDVPRDDGVVIRSVEMDGEPGMLIEFQSPTVSFRPDLRPIEDAYMARITSNQDTIIPRIYDVVSARLLDVDEGAQDESVLLGPAIFVKTQCTVLLDRTTYYSDLVYHMTYVFEFLHEIEHCLGFIDRTKPSLQYTTDRLLEKFGIDLADMEIELVDFTKIARCTEDERLMERTRFREIISFLGNGDYSSEETTIVSEAA